jgi:hypothetical protein
LKIFRVRKESSPTDDIFLMVQTMVEGLKSKIGHSHVVGIGIDETNGMFPAPWFPDSPFLSLENLLGLLDEVPGCHFSQAVWRSWKVVT